MTFIINGRIVHYLKSEETCIMPAMLCIAKCDLKNGRYYQEGEYIHFMNPDGTRWKGFEDNLFEITHVDKGIAEYDLSEGCCILSLKKVERKEVMK